ncbi:MAG: dephospho-CoA kinase [Nitrospirota bacterium]
MLRVALTGNLGMGKTTVLRLFEKLGAVTVDTDDVVRSLLREKHVLEKIKSLLGSDVFSENGGLDREKVAKMIFANHQKKRSLEDIIHPLVFEEIDSFLGKIKGRKKIIIIEIPLLFERSYENRFDRKITVFTDPDRALVRLEAKGMRRENGLLRLGSQLPVEEKIKRSDFVIDNNGSLADARVQVEKIYGKLLEEAENADN